MSEDHQAFAHTQTVLDDLINSTVYQSRLKTLVKSLPEYVLSRIALDLTTTINLFAIQSDPRKDDQYFPYDNEPSHPVVDQYVTANIKKNQEVDLDKTPFLPP